jgi:hypothetical protein
MTDDDVQLLREFRTDVPVADAEARRRVYAYAIGEAGRLSIRRSWFGRQHRSKRRIAVFAGATLCAAVVAVAVTGTFGGGGKQAARQPVTVVGGDIPQAPMLVNPTFSAGTLSSVTVTVNPDIADASVRVQVLHSDATTYANAYAAESAGSDQVVFQEQGPATNTSTAGAAGASTWSGTLSPSDWNGGCQSGLYRIAVVWVGPGTLFANPASSPNSGGGDESSWFSCTGS